MRIVVLPTLEYELYHGRNFLSVDETLFGPTERVLSRAERSGIPFTLFADVCSAWAFRNESMHDFADRFERQLIDSVKRGHDAQLHLHVHWLFAYFRDGEWQLREPKITLADLDFATEDPMSLIRRGRDYLETLIQRTAPAYRCSAFRAGGLSVEPRKPLMHALSDSGICIDTSIAKDYRVRHDVLHVDHTGMPAAPNWDAGYGVYEVPILTFRMNAVQRAEFLLRRLGSVRQRRGSPISRSMRQTRLANASTLVRQNSRYLAFDPVFLFSADTKGFTRKMLVTGFKDYVRRHDADSDAPMYVSMINHPKLMFAKEEQLLFEVFAELRDAYGERLSFQTFGDLARQLNSVNAGRTSA